jgi:hypothetical protein
MCSFILETINPSNDSLTPNISLSVIRNHVSFQDYNLLGRHTYSSVTGTLKVEAAGSFETLVPIYQTTLAPTPRRL